MKNPKLKKALRIGVLTVFAYAILYFLQGF
jgi:hypothetical protein